MEDKKHILLKFDQEMEIIDVLRTYPESTAFVFQVDLGAGNYDYYMKLSDPVFTPQDTQYVSVIQSMGFNRVRRDLWFGQYFIPRGKELKTCNNKQLLDMLEETAKLIKGEQFKADLKTINNFRKLGLL